MKKKLKDILYFINMSNCTFWACRGNRKINYIPIDMVTCSICRAIIELKKLIKEVK